MKHLPIFLIILALVSVACSGNSSQKSLADSIDTPVQANIQVMLSRLPDTCYSTVNNVKYTIIVYDSAPAEIDNLTSHYMPGSILTFRGNERRDADMGGKIKGTPKDFAVDWEFITVSDTVKGAFGTWGGGTGWTGQPLYVPNDQSAEIIIGSLASKVYFIDYATGKASRPSISTDNPIKGTVSLDPVLSTNLYVGHGVPNRKPFGALTIDLRNHEISQIVPQDPIAPRPWGAYDSSPVRVGQFLFRPGENGRIYKYLVEPGHPKLHSAMHYTIGGSGPGIESSMAVYHNYGYTADNHGHILCINLDNLKPVWHYALGDDADATPVVTVEDGKAFVYVACEVDKHPEGPGHIAKLDALTGQEIWNAAVEGERRDDGGKHFDGGFYATPLPGIGDCSDLIFANCVHNNKGSNGSMIAFERKTGAERYRVKLNCYSWSSPIPITNEKGEMYVITGDGVGNIYAIRGKNGEIVARRNVGSNFESSPIVVGSSLVIGSRGNTIFKIDILSE